jgi:hypothetical protein
MKCDIICFAVSTDPLHANSPTRGCVQCNTHQMSDFAPYHYEGQLCPVGKVEQAVEDGLAKITAAIDLVRTGSERAPEKSGKSSSDGGSNL